MSPVARPNQAAGSVSLAQEKTRGSPAAAERYIQENFEAADWLAVVVRNRETGETVQRISTAQRITSREFQSWLRHQNAHGFDIYLSLNSLKEHARGRTKNDLKEIRHLYLDLDEEGRRRLATIYEEPAVPHPNYVLETSPEKYQVIWRVEGIAQKDAEDLLRGLAQRFGGDPAATDATRVFRLPGFTNKKYQPHFLVKLAARALPERVYRRADFRIEAVSADRAIIARSNTPTTVTVSSGSGHTQSEKDWAYAVRRLRRGDSPEDIVREIAAYRSQDRYESADTSIPVSSRKPNPRYYAEHTVCRAVAHLGTAGSRKETRSQENKPDR